jgi:hypothetical protein
MMKRLFVFFFAFATQFGFSQGVHINQARNLYFSMDTDQKSVLKLSKLMNTDKQSSVPVLLAYKGASSAASAGQVAGVNNKFSHFKKGKTDLEQAIKLDPKDPEIRFLRLATQTNAPGFLLYKGNIREDKKLVLEGLSGFLSRDADRSLGLNMARFLLSFDSLTAREKQIVKQLSLQYEKSN